MNIYLSFVSFEFVFILDISTAVPVTNALTLLITYICDVISRPQLLNSSESFVFSLKTYSK
jgi:hypothetical protein